GVASRRAAGVSGEHLRGRREAGELGSRRARAILIMLWRRALACSALLLNLLGASTPPAPHFLLPDVAEPRRYALDLTIIPTEATFRGVVLIELDLKQRLSFLWLDGKDLTVDSAVLSAGAQSLSAQAVSAGGEFLGFAL